MFGYVKLFRSIKEKGWYQKSEYVHLFIHLLLKACHSNYESWFNGKLITLKPGELISGRKRLSEETGIDQHKVDRILKLFEVEQQIKQQTTNTSRLISITNWHLYQFTAQQTNEGLSGNQAPIERPLSTIQEGSNNDINVKNEKLKARVVDKPVIEIINPFKDETFTDLWNTWKEYRLSEHRYRFKTTKTEQTSINHLFDLSNGSLQKATEIVNNSIANGWKGLFKSDEKKTGTGGVHKQVSSLNERTNYEWL